MNIMACMQAFCTTESNFLSDDSTALASQAKSWRSEQATVAVGPPVMNLQQPLWLEPSQTTMCVSNLTIKSIVEAFARKSQKTVRILKLVAQNGELHQPKCLFTTCHWEHACITDEAAAALLLLPELVPPASAGPLPHPSHSAAAPKHTCLC